MKNTLKCWICFLLTAFVATSLLATRPQGNYNGLPGDDFSLEGALDLFKSCGTLEDFERELNSPDNNVNNLDLNNNGRIDYLRVVDHAEGDLHAIVIQSVIEQGISQDVAVIEVKRNRYGEAVVQIVGDEDLYGTAKIVEPYPYDDVVGTDYYDNYYNHYSPTVFVNAWAWPSVRFIFAPRYVVWVSPYYYDYYPGWYSPWQPYAYNVWYPRTVVYHHHYCVAPSYRIPEVHHYYGARRVSAPVVRQRTDTYVKANGGRSNFDYTKGDRRVDKPQSRSLDRNDKSTVATRTDGPREQGSSRGNAGNIDRAPKTALNTRTDRPREQGTSEKPRVSSGNTDQPRQTEVTPRTDRQREQSPSEKPRVAQPNTNNLNSDQSTKPKATAPDTRQREQSPLAKPQTTAPSRDDRRVQRSQQESPRQTNSPTARPNSENNSRGAAPSANKSVNRESGGNKSSAQAPARTQRQPAAVAAPKANHPAAESRTSSGSNDRSAGKSQPPRKAKG